MATDKRIVTVTGATGFVGRCFVARLLRENRYHIRCLVRRSSDVSALQALNGEISFHYGDITRKDTLRMALAAIKQV